MPGKKTITILTVRPAPGKRTEAIVQAGHLTFRAAIGRSGRTIFKREGDGATPIGTMPMLYGYWRPDRCRRPMTDLAMVPIRQTMLWCDQAGNANYNRPVRSGFAGSHERMARTDSLYDICLVMDWNITIRKQGCGSAIFFHLARDGFPPTEGCVAIRKRDMRRLLPLLGKGTVLRVL